MFSGEGTERGRGAPGRSQIPGSAVVFGKVTAPFWASISTSEHHYLPRWLSGKESACNAGDAGNDSWVRKIPWGRKWQPASVFFPGESHEQRSLVVYTPRGRRVGHGLVYHSL